MHRDAGARVARVGDFLEVLDVPADAVLRPEQRGEHARFVQHVRHVPQVGRDAGGIEDRSDPQPVERLQQRVDADHQYAFRERNPNATVRARMRRSSSSDQCSM